MSEPDPLNTKLPEGVLTGIFDGCLPIPIGNDSNSSRSGSQDEAVYNGFSGKPCNHWLKGFVDVFLVEVAIVLIWTGFSVSGYASLLDSCLFGENKCQRDPNTRGYASVLRPLILGMPLFYCLLFLGSVYYYKILVCHYKLSDSY